MKQLKTLPPLKTVVLECPYDNWDSELTRRFFPQVVSLKLRGYRAEYPYGVLPVDASDFVGTHLVLCAVEPGGLRPLITHKLITLDRCRTHNLTFPALSLSIGAGAARHTSVLEGIVKACDSRQEKLIYGGSLTIEPEARQHRELVAVLWEAMIAMVICYERDRGIAESITGGNVRFKMHRVLHRVGYRELSIEAEPLSPVGVYFAFGEQVVLYHRPQPSTESLALAEKYRTLWTERLEERATVEHPRSKAA